MRKALAEKLTAFDYVLMVVSLLSFVATIGMIIKGLSYIAIGLLFLCIVLQVILIKRQIDRPEVNPLETEEYKKLKRENDKSQKVSSVKINLLNAKVEEGAREKKFIEKKYKDSTSQVEQLSKQVEALRQQLQHNKSKEEASEHDAQFEVLEVFEV